MFIPVQGPKWLEPIYYRATHTHSLRLGWCRCTDSSNMPISGVWGEAGVPGENPCRYGENAQAPPRWWPSPEIDFFPIVITEELWTKWSYSRTLCTFSIQGLTYSTETSNQWRSSRRFSTLREGQLPGTTAALSSSWFKAPSAISASVWGSHAHIYLSLSASHLLFSKALPGGAGCGLGNLKSPAHFLGTQLFTGWFTNRRKMSISTPHVLLALGSWHHLLCGGGWEAQSPSIMSSPGPQVSARRWGNIHKASWLPCPWFSNCLHSAFTFNV